MDMGPPAKKTRESRTCVFIPQEATNGFGCFWLGMPDLVSLLGFILDPNKYVYISDNTSGSFTWRFLCCFHVVATWVHLFCWFLGVVLKRTNREHLTNSLRPIFEQPPTSRPDPPPRKRCVAKRRLSAGGERGHPTRLKGAGSWLARSSSGFVPRN